MSEVWIIYCQRVRSFPKNVQVYAIQLKDQNWTNNTKQAIPKQANSDSLWNMKYQSQQCELIIIRYIQWFFNYKLCMLVWKQFSVLKPLSSSHAVIIFNSQFAQNCHENFHIHLWCQCGKASMQIMFILFWNDWLTIWL